MTPATWREQVWLTFGFAPFRWHFGFSVERMWGNATLTIGPFWIALGWPGNPNIGLVTEDELLERLQEQEDGHVGNAS